MWSREEQRMQDQQRQLVRLEAAGDRTHVVVQRERKLRRFSGSALDLQFIDWIEEAHACLSVPGLEGVAAANFVPSSLQDDARTEMKSCLVTLYFFIRFVVFLHTFAVFLYTIRRISSYIRCISLYDWL